MHRSQKPIRLIVLILTICWLAACTAPPPAQPVLEPPVPNEAEATAAAEATATAVAEVTAAADATATATAATTLDVNDPLRSCISMFRFDREQAASALAATGSDPANFPTLWTFAMNFRAFKDGDLTQPYACLKVYERQGAGSSARYETAVTANVMTNPNVSVTDEILGIPIPCQVHGNVEFDTTTTASVDAYRPSGFENEPLGVARFGPGSGHIACDVDLQKIVADAIARDQITMTTTTLTATMLTTYTYSNFAIGAAGIVIATEGHTFLEYRPDGTACRLAVGNATSFCEPTAQRMLPTLELPINMLTILNGKPFFTSDVFYAIQNFEDLKEKPCDTRATQGRPYIRWSFLGNDLANREPPEPPARGFGLYHYLYDTTNTTKLVGCVDDKLADKPIVDFFTGKATIFIGGTPQTGDSWEGELYEVIIDPPGGSGGTDKAQ